MLDTVDLHEYERTLADKRRGGVDLRRHYAPCMHLLVSRWAARLSSHQFAILAFVLDRTVYHDKLSETVVFDQFIHGMRRNDRDEMVFCGLNISLPTLLKQLKELADDDLLHVRACVGPSGKAEIKPRLYAINCKKLFNLDIADEENPMILRMPKEKKAKFVMADDENEVETVAETARNLLKTSRKSARTPSKNPPQNFEGIYSDNTDTKVSIVGGAALAEPARKVSVDSAMEALRKHRLATRTQRTGNRPTRKSNTAANSPYSKVNVQAMLDDAMAQFAPALPRVIVADKPLGVLKKRMADAKVELDQFIQWAIQFWATTASSHERGARRRVAEGSKFQYTPIPAAPDFGTLCYRFPYFLAAYRSHLQAEAAGLATTREALLEQKVAKLERAVVAAKDETRSTRERLRSVSRRPAPTPAPRAAVPEQDAAPATRVRRPAPASRPAINFNDDLPPAWDELPQPVKARK